MKNHFFKVAVLALTIFVSSCSKDEPATAVLTPQPQITTLEVKTVSNLNAPQVGMSFGPVSGEFTKFSFSENAVVTNDNWDVAFRGTTILVNGGAAIGIAGEPSRTGMGAVSIANNTLSGVTAFPAADTFRQDGNSSYAIPIGSGNGWYNYNGATNIVTPLAGKVFVVKTHNGKYAKFEILSYYKDTPANPDAATSVGRHYTFKFVYQANSTTSF
ncbi:HmuY family protein [Flavobacterium psychrophilum]|uniref:HmuY family protein n=1 Tax=Flavobacterium psychrophilum TaxID=96345 RepID=UPI0004E7C5EF|nr:HmuY family protein [Flavobacterium psychrophilum]AIJ38459.1 hypothetical protein FPSM_01964 [Flavobacterium psychrophilum]EKT3974416.1 HmuY family protein [Flavobacterium psychrophilum]EKT4537015.1 HmuY family protein [Flavobacterium psychrophilum]EKT4547210.1 HmuY family protein [Flavobacterium psychrophilum]EKT4571105.1 HmuY family protein [Flavobacterium psychrophilum]